MSNSWSCPYCFHAQLVSNKNRSRDFSKLYIGDTKYGEVGLTKLAIRCLNAKCNEVFLSVSFCVATDVPNQQPRQGSVIAHYPLRPESAAREFPEYIPSVLRKDYIEASRIVNLSPKASATLSRRCLQGIIRDFCKISLKTLDLEIKALEKSLAEGKAPQWVTHESVEAIDHVRKIGNIGAHMERDIDVIIDIDEGEAKELIGLIELLFEEWYIAQNSRAMRLAKLKDIRDSKDEQKKENP